MASIVEWGKLLNSIYNNKPVICPECGGVVKGTIHATDKKVGFAILECSSCKKRVKLSRIVFPDDVPEKVKRCDGYD